MKKYKLRYTYETTIVLEDDKDVEEGAHELLSKAINRGELNERDFTLREVAYKGDVRGITPIMKADGTCLTYSEWKKNRKESE